MKMAYNTYLNKVINTLSCSLRVESHDLLTSGNNSLFFLLERQDTVDSFEFNFLSLSESSDEGKWSGAKEFIWT
jgi:hypothetical protein